MSSDIPIKHPEVKDKEKMAFDCKIDSASKICLHLSQKNSQSMIPIHFLQW